MTYKDCIHCDVCLEFYTEGALKNRCKDCEKFKDKSHFIELPCDIGDTLYDILEFVEYEKYPTLVKNKVDRITITKGRAGFNFIINGLIYYPSDFGVNVFTDLIEASEKLKELDD